MLDVLTALGDPTRRAIFEILTAGPASVGEIAVRLPVTRSAVSQHLKVLGEVHLVRSRPAGTRRIYQIDPDGVGALRDYLDQMWRRALTDLPGPVEPDHRSQRANNPQEDTSLL